MVKNYMEHLVELYFDEVLAVADKTHDVCGCDKCREDITARALNQLRPFYVTSKRGEVFAEYANLQVQYKADVYGALTRSIAFVNSHRTCGN